MEIKKKHFSDFSKLEKKELLDLVYQEFEKQTKISRDNIKDVFVTGSRTYKIGNKKDFFTPKSDLDIVVSLSKEEFYRYFNLESPDAKQSEKSPWLESFDFKEVKVSIFIVPEDNLDETKFRYWNLPLTSLLTGKTIRYNESHLLDYLQNVKGRVKPEKFCFLCLQEKDSPIIIDISISSITIPEIIKKDLLPKYRIYLCESCFQKSLENGLRSFLKQIEQI